MRHTHCRTTLITPMQPLVRHIWSDHDESVRVWWQTVDRCQPERRLSVIEAHTQLPSSVLPRIGRQSPSATKSTRLISKSSSRTSGLFLTEVSNAVLTSTIRLRFDVRSTGYQRSLRSQCHTSVDADPLAASHWLFTYLRVSAAAHTHGVGRRMVVAPSTRSRLAVES